MQTSIAGALTLMVIGMVTVFVVLFLVYVTGSLLIKVTNLWAPEKVGNRSADQPTKKQIAAITAAVSVITNGKASITRIQKQ